MSTALKVKVDSRVLKKKSNSKNQFSDPNFVLEAMSNFLKEGDISSVTDLISAYIIDSSKYKSQEEFAHAIGTTRQTLHRLLTNNEAVTVGVFFRAIERIYLDAQGK